MEPQMICVEENLSVAPHLHSGKIRISQDAAIFEIERELPDEYAKISSRYEIYNSTSKPFAKTYRELSLTSSTGGCESYISSISSSNLNKTTTYITCSGEIEPVQMTSFHRIDDHSHRRTVSVYNEQCYDNINEATNYDVLASTAVHLAHRPTNSDSRNDTIHSFEEEATEEEIVADKKLFANVASKIKTNNDCTPHAITVETWTTGATEDEPLKSPGLLQQMISARTKNGLCCSQPKPAVRTIYKEERYRREPLMDVNSIKTVTKCRSMMNLELKPPSPEPKSPTEIPPSTAVVCLSEATSQVNVNKDERQREKERITKTISLMLENRRRNQMLREAVKRQSPRSEMLPEIDQIGDTYVNSNVELVESRQTSTLDRSCRVTGEVLKRDRTPSKTSSYADYYRNVCTLPRSVKSHRTQLQRHFYYPQYSVKNVGRRVPDEELPDPDKVRNARELFERVLKIGSLDNVAILSKLPKKDSYATLPRPTPEIRQPSSILSHPTPLRKSLSVDTTTTTTATTIASHHRRRWTDNGSVSSGVGSDISVETDLELSPKGGVTSGSECGSKEDAIFTSSSDEDLFTSGSKDAYGSVINEDLGKPISPDVLDGIRAYGTSITYYGGKIIASSKGYTRSPMTMTIMNEIKGSSPDYQANRKLFSMDDNQSAKFRLIKSNSCGSRLELSDTDEYGREYEQKKRSCREDVNNNSPSCVVGSKRETDTIEEEETDEQPATQDEVVSKETQMWPNAKETASLFENKEQHGDKSNMKNWLKRNGAVKTISAGVGKPKSYCDMDFEEFEVLEEKN